MQCDSIDNLQDPSESLLLILQSRPAHEPVHLVAEAEKVFGQVTAVP
jgi:hypothetical protein